MTKNEGAGLHNSHDISIHELRACSSAYALACRKAGCDITEAGEKEKKSARRAAEHCLGTYYTGGFYAKYTSLPVDDFWRDIKENALLFESRAAERENHFKAFLETLDPDTADRIRKMMSEKELIDSAYDYSWDPAGKRLFFEFGSNCCFSTELAFTGVEFEGDVPPRLRGKVGYTFDLLDISPGKLGFELTPDEDVTSVRGTAHICRASFKDAYLRRNVFNALRRALFTPGDFPLFALCYSSSSIIKKSQTYPELVNEKEHALMPLFLELDSLAGYKRSADHPRLKSMAAAYGLDDIAELFGTDVSGESRNLLYRKLAEPRCEPLVRELLARIEETQKEYGDIPVDAAIAGQIEDELHLLGYEGSFPEFRKRGNTRGSLNFGGKRISGGEADFCVYCQSRENGTLSFFSGVRVLSGKDAPASDIISCMFTEKKKRLFGEFTVDITDIGATDGREFARIAAKCAELKKLSKEELKAAPAALNTCRGGPLGLAWAYLLIGVYFYVAFAALVCLILAVGGLLVSLIKWDISWFPVSFTDNWRLLVFLPLAGVVFLFVTAIFKKNKK